MPLIELNRNPSARDLRWFGLVLLAFFGLVAGILYLRFGSVAASGGIICGAAAIAGLYYLIPPIRRPLFIAWMAATYPIGWLLSHAVLAAVFYLVMTPIGLAMRLAGRDPLNRKFDRSAESYWVPHASERDPESYFRQF